MTRSRHVDLANDGSPRHGFRRIWCQPINPQLAPAAHLIDGQSRFLRCLARTVWIGEFFTNATGELIERLIVGG